MDPILIGQKYDKIADWWHERHKHSNYGLDQIHRAIKYCSRKKQALDVGCGSGGRVIDILEKNAFKEKKISSDFKNKKSPCD